MAMRLDEITSEQRLDALERSGLLDAPPQEAFDRLTRMASAVIGAPTSLVSLVDRDRQFFTSAVGLREDLDEARETPLSHSFCKYVVATGAPLVVDDARRHPVVQDNPAIADYGVLSYCGVPVRDDAGNVLGTFCVLDTEVHTWTPEQVETLTELAEMVMTEIRLRKVANDLQTTNSALLQANQALRDFISVASHDMKNPLTAVLGFSSTMTRRWDQLDEDRKRSFVEIIEKQARFLARLVDDLLTISKLEAGVVAPVLEDISLDSALSEALAVMPEGSEVALHVESGLHVRADADHLQRIVTNLVSNASKYGAPPIRVTARLEGNHIRMEVADSGSGVPEEFVPRLFEKFSRSDSEEARAQEGTGLGLSIVHGLVRAQGGTIHYEPNEPTGSRFVVRFPAP
jgi:signal transduction histidine kinase